MDLISLKFYWIRLVDRKNELVFWSMECFVTTLNQVDRWMGVETWKGRSKAFDQKEENLKKNGSTCRGFPGHVTFILQLIRTRATHTHTKDSNLGFPRFGQRISFKTSDRCQRIRWAESSGIRKRPAPGEKRKHVSTVSPSNRIWSQCFPLSRTCTVHTPCTRHGDRRAIWRRRSVSSLPAHRSTWNEWNFLRSGQLIGGKRLKRFF